MTPAKSTRKAKPAALRFAPRARRVAPKQLRYAKDVYKKLQKLYPDAHCALRHDNAYELLVATILSAQCTDARVNMVTESLFKKYPSAKTMAVARQGDIEDLIRSTGFYRNKAKSLRGAAQMMAAEHNGTVPDTMDALTKLPGVARKTANVVLGNAFGKKAGVVVDTHVARLSRRLGLTKQKDPQKIEGDLMASFERRTWILLAHLLIYH
ncbi:MAG: endonuclease III, partial [Pirellulaceae bacterium]|nr:endonuclease III [Pirellulaceae bacterium]